MGLSVLTENKNGTTASNQTSATDTDIWFMSDSQNAHALKLWDNSTVPGQ